MTTSTNTTAAAALPEPAPPIRHTLRDVAIRLGIGLAAVESAVAAGRLHAERVDGLGPLLVSEADLQHYARGGPPRPAPAVRGGKRSAA